MRVHPRRHKKDNRGVIVRGTKGENVPSLIDGRDVALLKSQESLRGPAKRKIEVYAGYTKAITCTHLIVVPQHTLSTQCQGVFEDCAHSGSAVRRTQMPCYHQTSHATIGLVERPLTTPLRSILVNHGGSEWNPSWLFRPDAQPWVRGPKQGDLSWFDPRINGNASLPPRSHHHA